MFCAKRRRVAWDVEHPTEEVLALQTVDRRLGSWTSKVQRKEVQRSSRG